MLTFLHLILMCRVTYSALVGMLLPTVKPNKNLIIIVNTHTHHMGMASHLEVALGFWPLLNNRCKFVPFDLGDIFIDVKKGFFFIYYKKKNPLNEKNYSNLH